MDSFDVLVDDKSIVDSSFEESLKDSEPPFSAGEFSPIIDHEAITSINSSFVFIVGGYDVRETRVRTIVVLLGELELMVLIQGMIQIISDHGYFFISGSLEVSQDTILGVVDVEGISFVTVFINLLEVVLQQILFVESSLIIIFYVTLLCLMVPTAPNPLVFSSFINYQDV